MIDGWHKFASSHPTKRVLFQKCQLAYEISRLASAMRMWCVEIPKASPNGCALDIGCHKGCAQGIHAVAGQADTLCLRVLREQSVDGFSAELGELFEAACVEVGELVVV